LVKRARVDSDRRPPAVGRPRAARARGRVFMIAVDFMRHSHKIHRDHEGSQHMSKIKLAS